MGARDDPRRLSRLRRRTRALLWAERLLAAALPACLPLAAYVILAVFGFAEAWLCVAALLSAAVLLARAARRFRAPRATEADRRIEAASGLRHRPLAALDDRVALGDPAWFALHQARAQAVLASARSGGLAPVSAGADPFALRAAASLLLIAGFVAGGAAAPQRLAHAFMLPAWPFAGPLVEASVTPPAYTGQPPVLLRPGQRISVLSGAHLGVILSGSTARIAYAGAALPGADADNGRRADGVITRSGRLLVGPWWHRLAAWDITEVAPAAPRLSLTAPTLRGANVQLSYDADDDYGLASLAIAISPGPGALPAGADLPAQTGQAEVVLNEADSPYAGLAVAVTLRADNLAGITAVTPPRMIRLPPIALHDQTARALAALRQRLALQPGSPAMAGADLAALSRRPPSAISYAADLQMAALAAALRGQEARPAAAVDRLAALIRQIEQGPVFAANQAVGAAARALTDTLEEGGSQAELDAALRRLADALAAKLAASGPGGAASGQTLDTGDLQRSLQRMAEQIAADERAGNMAKAQQELSQLQKNLDALQNARVMTPQEAQRAAAAGAAQGALAKLIQAQGQELDKTGQGTATPGEEGQLRNALNGLRQGLDKSGLSHIPGLAQAGQGAGRAMGQAQQGLGNGDQAGAASAEAKAIAQMQQAAAALQTAAGTTLSFGGSQPADETGANGTGEDQAIPGLHLDQTSPAAKIQQEIMHRDADPRLAPGTRAYLHRLLNP